MFFGLATRKAITEFCLEVLLATTRDFFQQVKEISMLYWDFGRYKMRNIDITNKEFQEYLNGAPDIREVNFWDLPKGTCIPSFTNCTLRGIWARFFGVFLGVLPSGYLVLS